MERVNVCSHLALVILLLKALALNIPLPSSAYNNGDLYNVWKRADLTMQREVG